MDKGALAGLHHRSRRAPRKDRTCAEKNSVAPVTMVSKFKKLLQKSAILFGSLCVHKEITAQERTALEALNRMRR